MRKRICLLRADSGGERCCNTATPLTKADERTSKMVNRNVNTCEEINTRLEGVLNAIATEAGIVLDLLNNLAEDLSSKNHQYARCCAIENLVAKIGCIADREVMAAGGVPAFGDAEHWFMLPNHQEAKESAPEVGVATNNTDAPSPVESSEEITARQEAKAFSLDKELVPERRSK